MVESQNIEDGRIAKTRWGLLSLNTLMACVLVWISWSSSRNFQDAVADFRLQVPSISIPIVSTPWVVQVAVSIALLVGTVAKEALFKRHHASVGANLLQLALMTVVVLWYTVSLMAPFVFYSSAREHRH